MGIVTKRRVYFKQSFKPDYIIPKAYEEYRYVLGKQGEKILGIIGMNPSAACDEISDSTVNTVINLASKLGFDGYMMMNMYPERGTNPKTLESFNKQLHIQNLFYIEETIKKFNIKDLWVCWGDNIIKEAKYDMLKLLNKLKYSINLNIFTFWNTTSKNNPSHPLYKKYKDIKEDSKIPFVHKIKKILIVGDNHGDLEIFEQIKYKENPDLIIHTGDLYNFNTPRHEISQEWIEKNIDFFVRGNHDVNLKTPQEFQNREEYEKYMYELNPYEILLNEFKIFQLNEINFLLTHTFEHDSNYATIYNKFEAKEKQNEEEWKKHRLSLIKDFNISIVISGHTHIPHIKNEHGFLHINPGSLKDKTYVIGNYDSKNKEFKFKIKNII